jgi:hypothetical protein
MKFSAPTGLRNKAPRSGTPKIVGKSVLVRGLNALAATISTPLGAPLVAATRLRRGSAGSARGAASFARQAVGTARDAGCTGLLVARADSGVLLCRVHRRGARGRSVLLGDRADELARPGCDRRHRRGRLDLIRYPRAIWDDQLGCWVSDAEAEYTAFTSKKG